MSDRASGTTFEQFRNAMTNPVARQQLGFQLSDEQAAWFVSNEQMLRSMYDAWVTGGPLPQPMPFNAVYGPPRHQPHPYQQPPAYGYPQQGWFAQQPTSGYHPPAYAPPPPPPAYGTAVNPYVTQPHPDAPVRELMPPAPYVYGPLQAVTRVFRNYVVFTGRASRPEFWWWALFYCFAYVAAAFADAGVQLATGGTVTVLSSLVIVAFFLPTLTVTVRRLRDAGMHWALLFLMLIPFFGVIVILILLCQPSSQEVHRRS